MVAGIFWRRRAALNRHAGAARHQVERDGHDADDERAQKREAEAVHLKIRFQKEAYQRKQQGIDDEREKTERENQQGQREQQ